MLTDRQTAVKTYSTFCHQRVQLNNALCKLHNKILVYRQCPACYSGHASSGNVFTARCNARIASAVLAIAIPSVCSSVCPSVRLSVTRRYCVKTTAQHGLSNEPSAKVLRRPNFLKMGIKYLNLSSFRHDNKGRKVCCKVSLYKNCQRQSCSAFRVVSMYW